MAIKNIGIDEASEQQLLDYATKFLNLELAPGTDPRSLIERAKPGTTEIFYVEDEPQIAHAEDAKGGEPVAGAGGMLGTLGRGDPKWNIIIPVVETEDNSGKNDVLVGVNGRAWQIKRGVEVTVPHRVVIALDNAITDIVRHDEQGEVDVRKATRFAYQVFSRPSVEEIKAWDAAIGAEFCA
jgi:hypothetical protein